MFIKGWFEKIIHLFNVICCIFFNFFLIDHIFNMYIIIVLFLNNLLIYILNYNGVFMVENSSTSMNVQKSK